MSDKALDAKHPAGSSLNDLFELHYYTLYHYFQSNFTDLWQKNVEHVVRLSEMTPQDGTLWVRRGPYANYLAFTGTATAPGTYSISLSFKLDDGTTIGGSSELVVDRCRMLYRRYKMRTRHARPGTPRSWRSSVQPSQSLMKSTFT